MSSHVTFGSAVCVFIVGIVFGLTLNFKHHELEVKKSYQCGVADGDITFVHRLFNPVKMSSYDQNRFTMEHYLAVNGKRSGYKMQVRRLPDRCIKLTMLDEVNER